MIEGSNDLATFGYDNTGNMTSTCGDMFGARTMVFDDENRMNSVTHGGVTDTYSYATLRSGEA